MSLTHIDGLEFFTHASMRTRVIGWIIAASGYVCLAACSSSSSVTKEPIKLFINIDASEQVNPDEWGRAAPIMLRIYELRSPTAFESADFFTLQSDEKKVLRDDAIVIDEFILRPGEKREIERKSAQGATAIGVLAGYRELGKSVWRSVYRLPAAPDAAWYRVAIPDRKQRLSIRVDQQAVSISKSNESQ